MTEHEWLALAAPYALDALDGEERAAFEAHVVGCVLCQAEVASFRDVAARLAAAAPDASPAPSLRRRVLAVARRPRQLAWLAAAACLVLALGAAYGYWRERADRQALEEVVASTRDSLAARDSLLAAVLAPNVGTVNLAATGKPPTARLFWRPRPPDAPTNSGPLPRARRPSASACSTPGLLGASRRRCPYPLTSSSR